MVPRLCWGTVLLCAAAAGQTPPAYKADVSLVNVAFTVRDAQGHLVPDLARGEVEVYEDGVLQSISFFARNADVPLTLGLLVDVSGSQEHFIKRHRHDVKEFLGDVLRPQDRAFLMSFGNNLRLLADYSASGAPLLEGLKRFDDGARDFPFVGPREERVLGTAFYDAIYYAATQMLAEAREGRRALLAFSDGEDNSSAHHMLDAIEAAQSADAPLYCLRYTERKNGQLNARNKYGISVMARVAKETGGADFDAEQGELRSIFRQIGDELRSSYGLAYHTTNHVRDGSFRKLALRVNREGLTVRTRTGYYSPSR